MILDANDSTRLLQAFDKAARLLTTYYDHGYMPGDAYFSAMESLDLESERCMRRLAA